MVGVKILIDVKEYERLKKCEDICKKTHLAADQEKIPEQSGSGLEEDERFRKICRDELQKLSEHREKSQVDAPDANLVTPQPQYIPPINIPNPRDSGQVQYEKVLPKDLNDEGAGNVDSDTDENDHPWYYFGPLSQ